MTEMSFVKPYPNARVRARAEANYHWLNHLALPPRLPRLLAVTPHSLAFEHIHGRHADLGDLIDIAAHLGELHGSAYRTDLCRAHLGRPHSTRILTNRGGLESSTGPERLVIPGFLEGRIEVLTRRLEDRTAPGSLLTSPQVSEWMYAAIDGPVAFYKDTNARNVLIPHQPTPPEHDHGLAEQNRPVTIDFDDLTLAPFGYDLAKLVVSLTMTRGRLPACLIQDALRAYNDATSRQHADLPPVSYPDLLTWAEIHHIFTSPYLGRGGYQHTWNEHRPHDAARPAEETTRP